jgi:hypothetical protein
MEYIEEIMKMDERKMCEFRRYIIRSNEIDEELKIEIDKIIMGDNERWKLGKIIGDMDKKILDKYFRGDNKIRNKKEKIPAIIRRLVWNKYVGEEKGKSKCNCCEIMEISQMNFVCGHIISEYNGGKIEIDNLRPICSGCNLSMGTMNMDKFKMDYFSKLL